MSRPLVIVDIHCCQSAACSSFISASGECLLRCQSPVKDSFFFPSKPFWYRLNPPDLLMRRSLVLLIHQHSTIIVICWNGQVTNIQTADGSKQGSTPDWYM